MGTLAWKGGLYLELTRYNSKIGWGVYANLKFFHYTHAEFRINGQFSYNPDYKWSHTY